MLYYELDWLYAELQKGAMKYLGASTFKENVCVNLVYLEESKGLPFLYSVEITFKRNFKPLNYKPIKIEVMGQRGNYRIFTTITQSKQKYIYEKLTQIPQIKELLAWEFTNARKQLKEFEKTDWFGLEAQLDKDLQRERNTFAEAAYKQKKHDAFVKELNENPEVRQKLDDKNKRLKTQKKWRILKLLTEGTL